MVKNPGNRACIAARTPPHSTRSPACSRRHFPMRILSVIFLLASINQAVVHANVPPTKEEMIHSADYIAVVEISDVDRALAHETPPPHMVMNVSIEQSATASPQRSIKGDLPKKVKILNSVNPYNDGCVILQAGRFLAFLKREGKDNGNVAVTINYLWEIKDSQVNWFGNTLHIDKVIEDIKANAK